MTRLQTLLFGGAGAASPLADFGVLLLRLVAGLSLAFAHGIGKLPPQPRFIEGTAEMGFPFPVVFAWAAGLAEFLGGILVALGLLTRPAAFFAAFTMGVAVFVRHAGDPFAERELAVLFLAVMAALAIAGSGRYGLDELVRRRDRQYFRRY